MLAFLSTDSYVFLSLVLADLTLPALGVVLVIGVGVFAFLRYRRNGRNSVEPSVSKAEPNRMARQDRPRPARINAPPVENSTIGKTVEPETIHDLPISRIEGITVPKMIKPLDESGDEGLLAAIDEMHDDSDADSDIRMIALHVLAGSKSSNAVEELSQIALYDLSTTLRAKAVGMLADFDHESVFETIVLACADPSREVRSAVPRPS
jgi:hypothetical protein